MLAAAQVLLGFRPASFSVVLLALSRLHSGRTRPVSHYMSDIVWDPTRRSKSFTAHHVGDHFLTIMRVRIVRLRPTQVSQSGLFFSADRFNSARLSRQWREWRWERIETAGQESIWPKSSGPSCSEERGQTLLDVGLSRESGIQGVEKKGILTDLDKTSVGSCHHARRKTISTIQFE